MAFSVLFVCTGNICRSPMAERLFATRIDPGRTVITSSAGTAGLDGFPMDPLAAQVLREFGGDGDGHVARRLSPSMIAEADLILTGHTSHRSEVVQADPLAFRRAFTLREFGRLGAGVPASSATATEDHLRERVFDVAAQRGQAPASDDDEIADPFGVQLRAMRACGQQIADAVDRAVLVLGLARRSDSADRRARID